MEESPQEEEGQDGSIEMQGLQKAYKELEARYEEKASLFQKIMIGMILLTAVLLVIILNLVLRKRPERRQGKDLPDLEKSLGRGHRPPYGEEEEPLAPDGKPAPARKASRRGREEEPLSLDEELALAKRPPRRERGEEPLSLDEEPAPAKRPPRRGRGEEPLSLGEEPAPARKASQRGRGEEPLSLDEEPAPARKASRRGRGDQPPLPDGEPGRETKKPAKKKPAFDEDEFEVIDLEDL